MLLKVILLELIDSVHSLPEKPCLRHCTNSLDGSFPLQEISESLGKEPPTMSQLTVLTDTSCSHNPWKPRTRRCRLFFLKSHLPDSYVPAYRQHCVICQKPRRPFFPPFTRVFFSCHKRVVDSLIADRKHRSMSLIGTKDTI